MKNAGGARPLLRIVELVGPAGAGKSELAHALGAADTRIELLNRFDKRANWPLLLLHAVPLLLRLIRLLATHCAHRLAGAMRWRRDAGVIRCGPGVLKAGLHGLLFLHLMRVRVSRRGGAGSTVVLDEGPVFMLARLDGLTRFEGFPAHFDDVICRERAYWGAILDAVLCLDAPDDVLVERIRRRSKAHIVKHRGRDEIVEFLARWRTSIRHTCERLSAESGTSVLRIDSSASSAAAICDDVLRTIGSGGAVSDSARAVRWT